jgi:hypothetical protein
LPNRKIGETVSFLSPNALPVRRRDPKRLTLTAKKRRRKQESLSSPSNAGDSNDDDLPDFDLDDDQEGGTTAGISKSKKNSQRSTSAVGEGEISKNMMASSSNKPVRSIQELLADRSLERKFEFEEQSLDVNLPDLAPIRRSESFDNSASFTTTSKKVERKEEARRLAKIAAEEEQKEKDRTALLDLLPGIRDESGKISPVKILDTGTWACIIALVLWEIYINTPLFDRAAPMVPVVY